MRAALSGLTTRGRCLLAAGLSLALCGLLLGQRDLLRAAVFLCCLPLAAAASVARTKYRLTCSRMLDPARVGVGVSTTVRLRVENVSRLPSGVLLMQDTLAPALGGQPRFVLDRIPPGSVREVSYPVRSEVRGRFRVGPLVVRLGDPFGLVELERSFTSVDDLIVTPHVSPLPLVRLGGGWSSGGDAHARAVAVTGHDDAATREYREGDDLRKVHWRSTARTGELMVRREEQPFTSRSTLLLDARAVAHHGHGPGSSLEWAVSAIASIGVCLLQNGYTLRLVNDSGVDLVPAAPATTHGGLLDALSLVTASPRGTLDGAVERLTKRGIEGVLVAVLGDLGHQDAEALGRLRREASSCVAVLMDTATWTGRPGGQHPASAAVLRRAGWRVLEVTHGTTLASVWPQAARGEPREVTV